jgi:hypothetical protein
VQRLEANRCNYSRSFRKARPRQADISRRVCTDGRSHSEAFLLQLIQNLPRIVGSARSRTVDVVRARPPNVRRHA